MARTEKIRFLNLRLSATDHARASEVGEARRVKRGEMAYALILEYLRDTVPAADWYILSRAEMVAKDEHWTSGHSVFYQRKMPAGLHRYAATTMRPKVLQQRMPARALRHLRDIARFYNLTVEDLFISAVEWARAKQPANGVFDEI